MWCPLHVIQALYLPEFIIWATMCHFSGHRQYRCQGQQHADSASRALAGVHVWDGKNACNWWESLASIKTVIGQREPLWEICGANVFPDNPILWASGSGVVTMAEKHNKHMHVWQEEVEGIKDENIFFWGGGRQGGGGMDVRELEKYTTWCVGWCSQLWELLWLHSVLWD